MDLKSLIQIPLLLPASFEGICYWENKPIACTAITGISDLLGTKIKLHLNTVNPLDIPLGTYISFSVVKHHSIMLSPKNDSSLNMGGLLVLIQSPQLSKKSVVESFHQQGQVLHLLCPIQSLTLLGSALSFENTSLSSILTTLFQPLALAFKIEVSPHLASIKLKQFISFPQESHHDVLSRLYKRYQFIGRVNFDEKTIEFAQPNEFVHAAPISLKSVIDESSAHAYSGVLSHKTSQSSISLNQTITSNQLNLKLFCPVPQSMNDKTLIQTLAFDFDCKDKSKPFFQCKANIGQINFNVLKTNKISYQRALISSQFGSNSATPSITLLHQVKNPNLKAHAVKDVSSQNHLDHDVIFEKNEQVILGFNHYTDSPALILGTLDNLARPSFFTHKNAHHQGVTTDTKIAWKMKEQGHKRTVSFENAAKGQNIELSHNQEDSHIKMVQDNSNIFFQTKDNYHIQSNNLGIQSESTHLTSKNLSIESIEHLYQHKQDFKVDNKETFIIQTQNLSWKVSHVAAFFAQNNLEWKYQNSPRFKLVHLSIDAKKIEIKSEQDIIVQAHSKIQLKPDIINLTSHQMLSTAPVMLVGQITKDVS